jgi:hypothetical protein
VRILVQQLIEALHGSNQCARLMINANAPGVQVPERVKRQWGEAMPIDLDPSYPLNMVIDDEGIHCCLSFGGPVDCTFPWPSIYLVQERDSQLGIVIEEHVPDTIRSRVVRQPTERLEPETPREDLRASPSRDESRGRPDRSGLKPRLVSVAPEQPPIDIAEPEPAPSDADEGDDARSRRAAFRVIDGGRQD